MKLVLNGHDERYVVEQSLMALFPGELPVYEPICPGDDDWAVVTLAEETEGCRITVELALDGKSASRTLTAPLSGTDFEKEGQRRHAMARCFFLAARDVTGATPPWGMLTGVRPDKPVTWALAEGKSPEEARKMLEEEYFVTPERSALALETGETALRAIRRLSPRDIDIYVGIPFCPTRCVYCSFVSQSVEKSFALVPPYVEALAAELRAGGEMVRRAGLRVRSFYMGGGTPTTLTAEQMDTVLTAFESSFDLTDCTERTVEAGRPDTITPEKLAVLRSHGVDRVSVNPQTLEDRVLVVSEQNTLYGEKRMVTCFDRSGKPLWYRRFDSRQLYHMVPLADGSVVVEPEPGTLVALDSDGRTVWEQELPFFRWSDVCFAAGDGLLAFGVEENPSVPERLDILAVYIDSGGAISEAARYPGGAFTSARGAVPLPSGGFLLHGAGDIEDGPLAGETEFIACIRADFTVDWVYHVAKNE